MLGMLIAWQLASWLPATRASKSARWCGFRCRCFCTCLLFDPLIQTRSNMGTRWSSTRHVEGLHCWNELLVIDRSIGVRSQSYVASALWITACGSAATFQVIPFRLGEELFHTWRGCWPSKKKAVTPASTGRKASVGCRRLDFVWDCVDMQACFQQLLLSALVCLWCATAKGKWSSNSAFKSSIGTWQTWLSLWKLRCTAVVKPTAVLFATASTLKIWNAPKISKLGNSASHTCLAKTTQSRRCIRAPFLRLPVPHRFHQ